VTDILAALLDACERTPNAEAMTSGAVTLTYGDLRRRVLTVAASLTGERLKPGDRVLFSVRPNLDGISLALGIIAAGGTVVFADPGAGESMFRARAGLAAPQWVAAESVLYLASTPLLRPLARRRGLELPSYGSVVPDARHIVAGRWLPGVPRGSLRVDGLLEGEAASAVLGDPSLEALIIFTSGTTDHPKAVVHSRLSLGTGLADFADRVGFAPGERVLTDQLMVGIPALISGAHWLLPPHGANPGAEPSAYLDLIPDADVLFAVPAALGSILTLLEAQPHRAPHLRAILLGGAPVLRPLLERIAQQLPETTVLAIYGMTEILPVAIADGADKLAYEGVGDFVGELMPTIAARIDADELVLGGEGLAIGYLGSGPLDELRTGDLARLEPGNRLVLSGRSKDMFIRGVTNVYPGLYEPVIAGIDGVADAAMVGLPDAIGDDRLVLVLVPSASIAGLSREHPLIGTVARILPGLIDAAVLPDLVMVAADLPRAGRSQKLDRAALTALVAEFVGAS